MPGNVSLIKGGAEQPMFPTTTASAAPGTNPMSRNPDASNNMMDQIMKFQQMMDTMRKMQQTRQASGTGNSTGMMSGKSGGGGGGAAANSSGYADAGLI